MSYQPKCMGNMNNVFKLKCLILIHYKYQFQDHLTFPKFLVHLHIPLVIELTPSIFSMRNLCGRGHSLIDPRSYKHVILWGYQFENDHRINALCLPLQGNQSRGGHSNIDQFQTNTHYINFAFVNIKKYYLHIFNMTCVLKIICEN